jgi:hypothetical protein
MVCFIIIKLVAGQPASRTRVDIPITVGRKSYPLSYTIDVDEGGIGSSIVEHETVVIEAGLALLRRTRI